MGSLLVPSFRRLKAEKEVHFGCHFGVLLWQSRGLLGNMRTTVDSGHPIYIYICT